MENTILLRALKACEKRVGPSKQKTITAFLMTANEGLLEEFSVYDHEAATMRKTQSGMHQWENHRPWESGLSMFSVCLCCLSLPVHFVIPGRVTLSRLGSHSLLCHSQSPGTDWVSLFTVTGLSGARSLDWNLSQDMFTGESYDEVVKTHLPQSPCHPSENVFMEVQCLLCWCLY